ncbi:MAG: hypothetical protein JWR03_1522 [Cohnella sp.]|nr:hypothetical protein [Cohnella sp.]
MGRELWLTRYHPNSPRFRKTGALPVDSTESVNAGLPRHPLTASACCAPARRRILRDHFPKPVLCRFAAAPALCNRRSLRTYPFMGNNVWNFCPQYTRTQSPMSSVALVPGLDARRRNGIESAGMKRVALTNPFDRQIRTFHRTVNLNRLKRICRTSRSEPASRRFQWRNKLAVKPDRSLQ